MINDINQKVVKPVTIVVGVADLQVSDDPNAVIVTHALGSCIAVCLWDPLCRAAGMLHYMLPLSSAAADQTNFKPAMFCDTGVSLLFDRMFALGCRKDDLVVKTAGGGTVFDEAGHFNIGRRNHTVLRKFLWKNSILVTAEDIGGTKSRTARIYVGSGRMTITAQGKEYEL